MSLRLEIDSDPRNCIPEVPGICHENATCTRVTPAVCSSTRPMSYRCECDRGFTGDGIVCTGEPTIAIIAHSLSRIRVGLALGLGEFVPTKAKVRAVGCQAVNVVHTTTNIRI